LARLLCDTLVLVAQGANGHLIASVDLLQAMMR